MSQHINPTPKQTDVAALDSNLNLQKQDVAIVLNANDTAPRNITAGQFVLANDGYMYTANENISYNQSASGKLTFASGGGLNVLNSKLANMGNLFGCVQYNANTDRTVESNRIDAMEYLQTNYFSKHYHFAVVRYSSGYYHGYICIGEYNEILIVEMAQDMSEKVIFWRKSGGTWYKNGTITQ